MSGSLMIPGMGEVQVGGDVQEQQLLQLRNMQAALNAIASQLDLLIKLEVQAVDKKVIRRRIEAFEAEREAMEEAQMRLAEVDGAAATGEVEDATPSPVDDSVPEGGN